MAPFPALLVLFAARLHTPSARVASSLFLVAAPSAPTASLPPPLSLSFSLIRSKRYASVRPESRGAADSVWVEYGRTMRPGCVRASGDASGKGAPPLKIRALPFPGGLV